MMLTKGFLDVTIPSMTSETLMLCEAAEYLRKNFQRPVHINTIRRWVDKGVKVRSLRVKLKSKRIGWRIFTTPEWLNEFVEECSGKEHAFVTERQGTPPEVLMRLKARGFDGPEEKRKVLGLSKRGSRSRTLPSVLPIGAVRDQDKSNNGTGIGRATNDAGALQGAAI
jgi:hypothetical protein